jgi:hypothetical protein
MNTDKATFVELNGRLLETVGDLQLGLHVDVEEQLLQDMRDAQGDVQEVLELVKNSMRKRGELTNKVLAEIERAEHEQIEEISRIAQRTKKAAQDNTDMKTAVLSLQAGDAPRSGIKPIRLDLLECKEDETNLIGSGAYGFVYRGTYQETPVAVKVVRIASCRSSARSNMENEILVHQLLQESPYVIRLWGALLTSVKCTIVMELAIGSLKAFLYDTSFPLAKFVINKVRFLSEIALGMEFLHSCSVLHRDLKPDNALIGIDFRGHYRHALTLLRPSAGLRIH